MEPYWTPFGPYLGHLWTCFGPFLCFWTIAGLLLAGPIVALLIIMMLPYMVHNSGRGRSSFLATVGLHEHSCKQPVLKDALRVHVAGQQQEDAKSNERTIGPTIDLCWMDKHVFESVLGGCGVTSLRIGTNESK